MSDDTISLLSEHSLSLLDKVDLCMLQFLLCVLENEVLVLTAKIAVAIDDIRREELRAQRARPNITSRRKSFEETIGPLSPKIFHRMFRMNRGSFDRLVTQSLPRSVQIFSSPKCGCFLMNRGPPASNAGTRHATDALGGIFQAK